MSDATRVDVGPGTGPLLPGLAAHPRGAAILGAVFIAFSGIIFRLSGVAPTTATFWRSALAAAPLWILGRVEDRRFGLRTRRERAWAVVAGLFFAADLQCFHYGVTLVGAGLGTVLPNLQVVVVALATWLLFGERPPARALGAIPVVPRRGRSDLRRARRARPYGAGPDRRCGPRRRRQESSTRAS